MRNFCWYPRRRDHAWCTTYRAGYRTCIAMMPQPPPYASQVRFHYQSRKAPSNRCMSHIFHVQECNYNTKMHKKVSVMHACHSAGKYQACMRVLLYRHTPFSIHVESKKAPNASIKSVQTYRGLLSFPQPTTPTHGRGRRLLRTLRHVANRLRLHDSQTQPRQFDQAAHQARPRDAAGDIYCSFEQHGAPCGRGA